MANVKSILRNSICLAAIVTLAFVAAASGQPGPLPIDRPGVDLLAGDEIGSVSRGAGSGRPRPAAVHRCRFRSHGLDRRLAGAGVFDSSQIRIDPTHGAILPVGDPAPGRPFTRIRFDLDDPGIPHLRFTGTGDTSCRRWLPRYGRSADFRDCSTGLEWMDRGSVY